MRQIKLLDTEYYILFRNEDGRDDIYKQEYGDDGTRNLIFSDSGITSFDLICDNKVLVYSKYEKGGGLHLQGKLLDPSDRKARRKSKINIHFIRGGPDMRFYRWNKRYILVEEGQLYRLRKNLDIKYQTKCSMEPISSKLVDHVLYYFTPREICPKTFNFISGFFKVPTYFPEVKHKNLRESVIDPLKNGAVLVSSETMTYIADLQNNKSYGYPTEEIFHVCGRVDYHIKESEIIFSIYNVTQKKVIIKRYDL